MPHSIVILASGKGSNAVRIIEKSKTSSVFQVSAVISDKASAPVLEAAKAAGINARHMAYSDMVSGGLLELLNGLKPRLVVLAGFMRLIPTGVVSTYGSAMVNVHPALLPAYGGRGMYGDFVHKAVLEAGETQSGISIHYVSEEYDEGAMIAQFHCPVVPGDDLAALRTRIQSLEHQFYPLVIEALCL